MASSLKLEVMTPKGRALEVTAKSVQAQSVSGEFGVLPDHLPVLAALKCGLLHYTTDAGAKVAAMGPGFVEAEPDRVNVLTDLFAKPEDISQEEAESDLAEADKQLQAIDEDVDSHAYREALRDLEWAQARLDALAASSH